MRIGDVAEQPIVIVTGIEELVGIQPEAETVGVEKGGEGEQVELLPDADGMVCKAHKPCCQGDKAKCSDDAEKRFVLEDEFSLHEKAEKEDSDE